MHRIYEQLYTIKTIIRFLENRCNYLMVGKTGSIYKGAYGNSGNICSQCCFDYCDVKDMYNKYFNAHQMEYIIYMQVTAW